MAEYIKREDAIDLFWAIDPENDGNDGCMIVLKCGNYDSNEIEAMLSALPAAEVAEVRHGYWKPYEAFPMAPSLNGYPCSECGMHFSPSAIPILKYCPNCGARMDKEAEQDAD